MNFIGHVVVVDRLARMSPERALGAALPDLASIARVHVEREALPPEVRRGVALHLATDAAFHAEPAFREGSRQLTSLVTVKGLGRGAGRAVGHVGWELLLDGVLLHDPGASTVFEQALAAAPAALPAFAPGDRASWLELVDGLVEHRWWVDYGDPEVAASRIERMLRHRPRLRFDRELVPAVADALGEVQASVATAAPEILAAVTATLTAP